MSARITRVILKNYKSIVLCDVKVGPLTILVGPNGAGKSNFVDAMRFCRDALRTPLDQVFARRNTNVHTLLHRPSTDSDLLEMQFEFVLDDGRTGFYAFAIGPQSSRGFEVRREVCKVQLPNGKLSHQFDLQSGKLRDRRRLDEQGGFPAITPNRLYLVNASGLRGFQPVYELLAGMEFYSPDPETMRKVDTTGSGDILDSDGENIARVLDRLSHTQVETKARIEQYLRAIVPGLERLEVGEIESYKLLVFYLSKVTSGSSPPRFLASSMSDGTLRALATLVALFQGVGRDAKLSLVAIEEPETGLHPGATAVLLDAMREASESVQVVVTSHSTDLLDNPEISGDMIRAVSWQNGQTEILGIDAGSEAALHKRLYTAGELLRMGRLFPASDGDSAVTKNEAPLSQ